MNSGGRNGTLMPLKDKKRSRVTQPFASFGTEMAQMLTFSEEDSVRAGALGLLFDLLDVPGRSVTGSDL